MNVNARLMGFTPLLNLRVPCQQSQRLQLWFVTLLYNELQWTFFGFSLASLPADFEGFAAFFAMMNPNWPTGRHSNSNNPRNFVTFETMK